MNRLLFVLAALASLFLCAILPNLMFTGQPEKYFEVIEQTKHLDSLTEIAFFILNNSWSSIAIAAIFVCIAVSGKLISKNERLLGYTSLISIAFSVAFIVTFLLALIDPIVRL